MQTPVFVLHLPCFGLLQTSGHTFCTFSRKEVVWFGSAYDFNFALDLVKEWRLGQMHKNQDICNENWSPFNSSINLDSNGL